jgi:hypothetical protein
MMGAGLPEASRHALVSGLKLSDKGMDVFKDNLAWNTPKTQAELYPLVISAFEK